MTKPILCLLACLTVAACSANTGTTVIVPAPGGVHQGAGCVDGFGPIQSGTALCVGYSG